MSFQQFLNSIMSSFNTVFSHIIKYIELLLQNNFIKFIVFLSLVFFIIWIIESIINMIYLILNHNHDKKEIIKILGTKNDEISKNGGNIKSKDIYW